MRDYKRIQIQLRSTNLYSSRYKKYTNKLYKNIHLQKKKEKINTQITYITIQFTN